MEPFTKAVICVVPALVFSLHVVAGLQRLLSFPANSKLVTPHAQRERGKVIRAGVHIYMFVDKKKFESYFSDRLTFLGLLVEFID